MELCEFAASQKVDVEAEADTWLRRVRPCGVRKPPGTQGSFEKSVAHQNSERYPCVRNVSCRQLHDYHLRIKVVTLLFDNYEKLLGKKDTLLHPCDLASRPQKGPLWKYRDSCGLGHEEERFLF